MSIPSPRGAATLEEFQNRMGFSSTELEEEAITVIFLKH